MQGHSLESIRNLLKAGFDPNAEDRDGFTPLHYAVRWKQMGALELLLNANANPNHSSKTGVTPVHEAAGESDEGILHILVAKNIDTHNLGG